MSPERRRFLIAVGGIGAAWAAGATLFPLFKYLSFKADTNLFGKDGRAPVDKIMAADVAVPGTGRNGSYSGRGLIVLRNANGELKAFDSKCTHAGCNVGYQGTQIYCNCHGGTYDLNGKNIAGPPPRPLTELHVEVEGDRLFVSPMKQS